MPGPNIYMYMMLMGFEYTSVLQVREHSADVERCGPHVAISPTMLRSSNAVRVHVRAVGAA